MYRNQAIINLLQINWDSKRILSQVMGDLEVTQLLNGFAVQSNIIWEDQNAAVNFIWKNLRL